VTDPDLVQFVDAPAEVYGRVIEELTDGRKRTHWLGHSALAQRYAIRDLEQARRYLADPMLGSRLRDGVRLMIGHKVECAPSGGQFADWELTGAACGKDR
jgi:uncharacterized protein (DUF1810 family)